MGSIHQHTPAAKFDDIPGELPQGNVPENFDTGNVKNIVLAKLNELQKDSFTSNVTWRDILAFTDTIRTFTSNDKVVNTLKVLSTKRRRSAIKAKTTQPRVTKIGASSWLDIDVNFTIQDGNLVGSCVGIVSAVPDAQGTWQIWMLRTWLECWDGHGHPDFLEPETDESRMANALQGNDQVYDVIIVGAGQNGLSTAGRLQALGISYILFESFPSIGGVWANRYDSLRWHTLTDYGGLPFGWTFPVDSEEMLPTKKIANGHRQWSEKYGINARTGTKVNHADYDEASQLWTVHTMSGETKGTWKGKKLILSIGPGCLTPISPDWASPENVKASGFTGTIIHSADYHNPNGFEGKRGIVVGTANTAHDVAEDMANLGMETTIVQRNPTFIFPVEWLTRATKMNYNREKPIRLVDREQFTFPNKILREIVNYHVHAGISANPERFDALEKTGFKVDRYGDVYTNLYVRFGGHYVDTGACQRIVNGEIKVKSKGIKDLTPSGLLFDDGTEIKADLIVLATGFEHDFRKDAATIVGPEVAEQMDDFWGIDAEGEIRGNAKFAGHPHLMYLGGDTRIARLFSMWAALQIQKELLGCPLQPYTS